MTMRKFTAIAAAIGSLAGPPTLATAQTAEITPEQVTTRIDLAARQRMLLERMAKSLCFAKNGTHVWDNELSLQEAYISFAIAHVGIAKGDEKLGVFADTNRNFEKTWKDLDLNWVTLRRLYDGFVDSKEINARDYANVLTLTDTAHDLSDDIVVQIRADYTRFIGAGGLGSSVLLDLYSRQKELSQKLSKEVCLASSGVDRGTNLKKLAKTLKTFQVSLDGFRNGLPQVGIKPPPTERIAVQLDRTNDRWNEVRAFAEKAAGGAQLTAREMADFEFGIDQVLREIERVVFLLSDHLGKTG